MAPRHVVLVTSMAAAVVADADSLAASKAKCAAFKPNPLITATVSWNANYSACNMHCAAKDSLACMTLPDGVISVMEREGMADSRPECKKIFKPSEDDPEVTIDACPEWKLVLDMHGGHKLGNMTLDIWMLEDKAIDALSKHLRAPPGQEAVVIV